MEMKLKKITATAIFFFSDGPVLGHLSTLHASRLPRLLAEHYGKTCIHITALKTFFRRVYISFRSFDSEFLIR